MSTMKSTVSADLLLELRNSESPDDWRTLGQLLTGARALLLPRHSAGDVARATEMSVSTIWSVESGKIQPLRSTVASLVRFYEDRGISFDRGPNGKLFVALPAETEARA